jgi:hypothetical protein
VPATSALSIRSYGTVVRGLLGVRFSRIRGISRARELWHPALQAGKQSLDEGHGFSRATPTAADEGFSP